MRSEKSVKLLSFGDSATGLVLMKHHLSQFVGIVDGKVRSGKHRAAIQHFLPYRCYQGRAINIPFKRLPLVWPKVRDVKDIRTLFLNHCLCFQFDQAWGAGIFDQ